MSSKHLLHLRNACFSASPASAAGILQGCSCWLLNGNLHVRHASSGAANAQHFSSTTNTQDQEAAAATQRLQATEINSARPAGADVPAARSFVSRFRRGRALAAARIVALNPSENSAGALPTMSVTSPLGVTAPSMHTHDYGPLIKRPTPSHQLQPPSLHQNATRPSTSHTSASNTASHSDSPHGDSSLVTHKQPSATELSRLNALSTSPAFAPVLKTAWGGSSTWDAAMRDIQSSRSVVQLGEALQRNQTQADSAMHIIASLNHIVKILPKVPRAQHHADSSHVLISSASNDSMTHAHSYSQSLQHVDPLAAALLIGLQPHLSSCGVRELSSLARVLAKLSVSHESSGQGLWGNLLERFCRRMRQNPTLMLPQHLVGVMWAMAKIRSPDFSTFKRLAKECLPRLHTFEPLHLSNLAWACGRLGYSDPHFLGRLSDAAFHKMSKFEVHLIPSLLTGMVEAGHVDEELFAAAVPAVLENMPFYSGETLTSLLASFAAARLMDPSLLNAASARLTPSTISLLRPNTLCTLITTLAQMKHYHATAYHSACQALTQHLHHASSSVALLTGSSRSGNSMSEGHVYVESNAAAACVVHISGDDSGGSSSGDSSSGSSSGNQSLNSSSPEVHVDSFSKSNSSLSLNSVPWVLLSDAMAALAEMRHYDADMCNAVVTLLHHRLAVRANNEDVGTAAALLWPLWRLMPVPSADGAKDADSAGLLQLTREVLQLASRFLPAMNAAGSDASDSVLGHHRDGDPEDASLGSGSSTGTPVSQQDFFRRHHNHEIDAATAVRLLWVAAVSEVHVDTGIRAGLQCAVLVGLEDAEPEGRGGDDVKQLSAGSQQQQQQQTQQQQQQQQQPQQLQPQQRQDRSPASHLSKLLAVHDCRMLAQLEDPTSPPNSTSTDSHICSSCSCNSVGVLCRHLTRAAHQVWRASCKGGGKKSSLRKRESARSSVLDTLTQMKLQGHVVYAPDATATSTAAATGSTAAGSATRSHARAAGVFAKATNPIGGGTEASPDASVDASVDACGAAVFDVLLSDNEYPKMVGCVNGMWVDVIAVGEAPQIANHQQQHQQQQPEQEEEVVSEFSTAALMLVGADCFVRGGDPESAPHHHAVGDLVLLQRRLALRYGKAESIGVLHEWGKLKGDPEQQRMLVLGKLGLGPTVSQRQD